VSHPRQCPQTLIIADICPEDFEEDQNNNDSDGQVSFTYNKNFDFNITNLLSLLPFAKQILILCKLSIIN